MASHAEIVQRVRRELGDLSEPFRQSYRGTGEQDEFDLPVARVSTSSLSVFTVDPNAGEISDEDLVTDEYQQQMLLMVEGGPLTDAEYTIDAENGVIRLTDGPLPKDFLLVVEGVAYGMFTDEELGEFVSDAIILHTEGRTHTTRYRDENGFIRYEKVAMAVENLPEIEMLPVAMLATVEALWALSTDAATDIDITTSEGTHVARTQRYAQLRTQIDVLTEKYQNLCSLLNVGLYRIEVANLRRVSRLTNRLVPVYVEREFDETTLPTRIVTEIDSRDADPDGPPSPAGNMGLY